MVTVIPLITILHCIHNMLLLLHIINKNTFADSFKDSVFKSVELPGLDVFFTSDEIAAPLSGE